MIWLFEPIVEAATTQPSLTQAWNESVVLLVFRQKPVWGLLWGSFTLPGVIRCGS